MDIREDGSILLNMDYFSYATGLRMVFEDKWERLFGVPRRRAESEISQVYMDMALAIQQVTEEIVMKLCQTAASLPRANIWCWREVWRSTVSPTAKFCAQVCLRTSGFNPPRATRAGRWGGLRGVVYSGRQ